MPAQLNIYDRSAKVLFRERPADFLRLALGDIDPARVRIENPELNLPEMRADEVTLVDERLALVVEFMIEPDPRALRSWFIKTALTSAAMPEREVMLAVYYMTPGGYATIPSEYRVSWGEIHQRFQFISVRMWEHVDAIRSGRSRVLAPFLILWSRDDIEQALAEARRLCLEEQDPQVRSDLLSVAITVASRIVHDKNWLFAFFREELEMIRTGTIVDDWIEEGVQKGRLEAERACVLEVLKARFELVPSDLMRAVADFADASLLQQLVGLAAKVVDLDQFREKLRAAGAKP